MTLGINTLLLSTGALGSFTCSGMTLPIYMGPTALGGIRAMGDTLSNVESQVFTPYNFGSSRDRTPDLLTTRPMCYHSATSLCYSYSCLLLKLWKTLSNKFPFCRHVFTCNFNSQLPRCPDIYMYYRQWLHAPLGINMFKLSK